MSKQRKQYGTWPGVISAQMMGQRVQLSDVAWDSDGETLVWVERRGNQSLLLAQRGIGIHAPTQLNPPDMRVSGRVGYGGGEFTVHDGVVYFAGGAGRLYRVAIASGSPKPITPSFGGVAAPTVSPDGKWVVYVHHQGSTDGLAVVDTHGEHWPRKLDFNHDFVMQPTWHPAGTHLAYIVWDHPSMPWDGTELHLATLAYDHAGMPYIETVESITGDENTAIFQPMFSPDGRYLAYISDQTDYGQIYLYDLENGTRNVLTDAEAEHGQPAWIQGLRNYAWQQDSTGLYFVRSEAGFHSLHHYDLSAMTEREISALNHYNSIGQPTLSVDNNLALIVSSPRISERVITYNEHDGERVHARASAERIPMAQLADADALHWQGHDGETVHGLYYAPTSDRYEGIGAPPLIVVVHGGPTSQQTANYDGEAQFFATRGFAVLYVNHRGSTGYGKAYKDKHRSNWGVYDVEDCVTGAEHLISRGLADKNKIIIAGGSAGGYTVLQSLVDKPGFYAAGISRYGISNQFALIQDTHKFEERYSETLLGVLPEAADTYRARSPLFHAEKISDPLLIFQGTEDTVVPKNQSDMLVASLKERGITHEYHVFEGEGHGFRQPENRKAYYEIMMRFLNEHVIYR